MTVAIAALSLSLMLLTPVAAMRSHAPVSTANAPASTANAPVSTANAPVGTANAPVSTAQEARRDTAGRTQPGDIRGGWRAERYTMKDGTSFTVDGQILFTGKEWTVLFLVMANGQAARGAGEGGSYVIDGDRITLTHRYNISAGKALNSLPESPLRMDRLADDDPKRLEPCTFDIRGDRLTLRFPSGNAMFFVRSS